MPDDGGERNSLAITGGCRQRLDGTLQVCRVIGTRTAWSRTKKRIKVPERQLQPGTDPLPEKYSYKRHGQQE